MPSSTDYSSHKTFTCPASWCLLRKKLHSQQVNKEFSIGQNHESTVLINETKIFSASYFEGSTIQLWVLKLWAVVILTPTKIKQLLCMSVTSDCTFLFSYNWSACLASFWVWRRRLTSWFFFFFFLCRNEGKYLFYQFRVIRTKQHDW